jgi:hypothetical protein
MQVTFSNGVEGKSNVAGAMIRSGENSSVEEVTKCCSAKVEVESWQLFGVRTGPRFAEFEFCARRGQPSFFCCFSFGLLSAVDC